MTETFKSLFDAGPPDTWPWAISSYKDHGMALSKTSDGSMTREGPANEEDVSIPGANYPPSASNSLVYQTTVSSRPVGKRPRTNEAGNRARSRIPSSVLHGGIAKSVAPSEGKVLNPEAVRQMMNNGMDTSPYSRNSLSWSLAAGISSYDAPCGRVLKHTYYRAKECIAKSNIDPSRLDRWAAEINIEIYQICVLLVKEMY